MQEASETHCQFHVFREHICRELSTWAHRDRQHDVVEFANFLMHRTGAMGLQARWEARVEVERHIEVRDTGHNPVHLVPESGRTVTMPVLIETWHSQIFRHAFVELPNILMAQLGRFNLIRVADCADETCGYNPFLIISWYLNILGPACMFVISCTNLWQRFVIREVLPTLDTVSELLRDENCSCMCDDNVPPTRHELDDIPEIVSRNVYVVLYSRA